MRTRQILRPTTQIVMVKMKMSTRFTITTWKQIFPTISKIKNQKKNVRIMIHMQLPSMSPNIQVDEMEE